MSVKVHVRNMAIAAVLTALGIVIPMFMPKIVLNVFASYTLASHVPIFIGVFISPIVGVIVAVGTTLGFLLSGLDISIVVRAASHILWVVPMAALLYKGVFSLKRPVSLVALSAVVAVVHAVLETLIIFWYPGWASFGWAHVGFSAGYVAHSLIDFYIAYIVYMGLSKAKLV